MTDQTPVALQRFAVAFERAVDRELASGARRSHRRAFGLTAAAAGAVAAIAAIVILGLAITSRTTLAYALTHNPDGSITVSLDNLTSGVSQLNARLRQLGINDTVIPVTFGCTTSTVVLPAARGSLSERITIGTRNTEPAGVDGYLAAEQLPDGRIGLGIGGMKPPLPPCFSPRVMTVSPASSRPRRDP